MGRCSPVDLVKPRLSRGERVALYGVLFFASAGVGTWALTLPSAALFALGIGWGLMVREILDWAEKP